jgi:thioredoxin reductase (NADPH)
MRRVLVVSGPRRRNSFADSVHNIPFIEGTKPSELYDKMERDALAYGVEFVWDEVVSAEAEDIAVVHTANQGSFTGQLLLLATGMTDQLPAWLPDGAWGQQAFDCPLCHTREKAGQSFVCVGEGVDTLEHGLLTVQYTDDLTAIISDPSLLDSDKAVRLRKAGAQVLLDTVVSATTISSGELALVTNEGRTLTAGIVLLNGTMRPNTKIAESIGLESDEQGRPVTSPFGRTSNPRVWNAGNSYQYYMWTGAASSGLNAAISIGEELAFGEGRV